MVKLIGVAIAITWILSSAAHADPGGVPSGLGTGTVATATPTGLVAGTASATPSDTPTVTPTPSDTPTLTPLPGMRTLTPLIDEDGCAISGRPRTTAWWLVAVPLGIAPARYLRTRFRPRRRRRRDE